MITSVGSRGDSYDNAMAESIIGLYNSELITMVDRGAPSKTSISPPSAGSTGGTPPGLPRASAMSPPVEIKGAHDAQQDPALAAEDH